MVINESCWTERSGYDQKRMDPLSTYGLIASIFVAAVLYSSVGHAGASGYLAAMALFSVAPEQMKPSALILNICVAVIATTRFVMAKAFSLKLFIPLAICSVPAAYIGGALHLPGSWYRVVVGVLLFIAAIRLAFSKPADDNDPIPAPLWQAAILGAVIGLLSGLTGVGGGIYLTPVVLFAGWARPREAGGVSAAFILVNSIAGLAGHAPNVTKLPPELPYWAAAAIIGGAIGSHFGSKRIPSIWMKRILAVVLAIAAFKLALTQ